MKRKVLSVIMAAAMAVSMMACGSSNGSATSQTEATKNDDTKSVATVENSASLTDKANIDNSVERDSITIGWQDATTLAP